MVEATEIIVDIGALAGQAWISEGIPAMRRKVEERLLEARRKHLAALRDAGRHAVAWGYHLRKTLQTPWGDLGPIRIPRIRSEGRELRLFPRQIRRIDALERMAAQETLAGVPQRRIDPILRRTTGQSMSAATVGGILGRLGGQVERIKSATLSPESYQALVLDAVWGRYRGRGQAALVAAVGIGEGGAFDVVDWQAASSESCAVYERLLTRLWERGLSSIRLIVGDGAGAIESARQIVYPDSQFQLCLWHLWRSLKCKVRRTNERAFSRDFWEVYSGLDRSEVERRMRRLRRVWAATEPAALAALEAEWPRTQGYLAFPPSWRHRVRTVNLAEGFFRNLRRFLNRWPGFLDEGHLSHVIGLYLLGARPQLWHRPALHPTL